MEILILNLSITMVLFFLIMAVLCALAEIIDKAESFNQSKTINHGNNHNQN